MTGMGAALNVAGMVSPIGRGLVNTQLQYTTNKENRRFALEQQRLQNQFNLDMWNRQNAYNTPAAQVQRLMAAGLNPNLAYGQLGAGEAGALTSAGANYKGEAPQLSGDFAGSVQSFMSISLSIRVVSLFISLIFHFILQLLSHCLQRV